MDSFIRLLLYANEFNIEGLIISSSQWHYKGDGKGTKFISEMEMTKNMYGERTELRWPGEQWIYNLVDAYGKVYPNLKLHATDYPTAEHLRSLIRIGNIDFEGEMEKNTEGSDFIKAKLLDDDMEPLYLQVWGGRLTQSETQPNRWEDGEKAADFNPFSQKMDKAYAQARWVPTLQNDFAVRADWCIKDYKNANHPPQYF